MNELDSLSYSVFILVTIPAEVRSLPHFLQFLTVHIFSKNAGFNCSIVYPHFEQVTAFSCYLEVTTNFFSSLEYL